MLEFPWGTQATPKLVSRPETSLLIAEGLNKTIDTLNVVN